MRLSLVARRSVSNPIPALCALVAALLIGPPPSVAGPGQDADADGVEDAVDNCPVNPNGHQENADPSDDGLGDVCDRDTINAIFEPTFKGKSPADFHASTPFQRARIGADATVAFSSEAGMFTPPNAGIGLGGDDSGVILVAPQPGISGVVGNYKLAKNPDVRQSTWHSVVALAYENRSRPPIRLHAASAANAVGLLFELDLTSVAQGSDVEIPLSLALPPGWLVDDSEAVAGGGEGRLTITDAGGSERIRGSAVGLVANGMETILKDGEDFFGLQRLTEELNSVPLTASVGDADKVGSNWAGGVEAHCDPADVRPGAECTLVESSYTLRENQADSDLGRTGLTLVSGSSYTLRLIAPADFIERNRATSRVIGVGIAFTSLTPVDFASGKTVRGAHVVGFGEEVPVTGHDTKIVFENVLETFDKNPVDYQKWFADGGTAEVYDWGDASKVGLGFAGTRATFTGSAEVHFNGGGAGIGVGPGARVGPAHPCLASEPLVVPAGIGRCAEGRGIRGSFTADSLLIRGSMSGLAAAEADVTIGDYTYFAGTDPEVVDETTLHAVVGLGCSADEGIRVSVNPFDRQILANVPVDPGPCTADEVGAGTCQVTPLATPPTTGVCRLVVRKVLMHGIASLNNPEGTDLTRPAGVGIACGAKYGTCEIGPKSNVNGVCQAGKSGDPGTSWIEGFNGGIAVGGGANVDPATGEPLRHDDASAVPPFKVCLDKVIIDDTETAYGFGPNSDAELSRCSSGTSQFAAVVFANGGANSATVANTAAAGVPCPSLDGVHCQTPAERYACPTCKQGAKNFRAVSALGLTAPTKVAIRQCDLGIDLETGEPSSGQNPALALLDVDPDLKAVKDANTLTIAGRVASLSGAPVVVARGSDGLLFSELVDLEISASNLGAVATTSAHAPAISIAFDNTDSPAADQSNVSANDVCYAKAAGQCVTGEPIMASAESDQEVIGLNAEAESLASSLEKPAGGDVGGPFKCYSSQPLGSPPEPVAVTVEDLLTGSVQTLGIGRSINFCSPVNKEHEGVPDAVSNLHCHEISGDQSAPFSVTVSTQFGTDTLLAVNAKTLCVPAVTSPGASLPDAEQALNHYKCYLRDDDPPGGEATVLLEDEYDDLGGPTTFRVKSPPFMVCSAVTPTAPGGGLADPEDHLACYKLSDAQGEPMFPGTVVNAADQLDPAGADIDLVGADLLCERAKAVLAP